MKRRSLAALALAIPAVMGAGAPAQADGPATARGATVHGCPYGAFCIYPGDNWNNDRPEYVFYSYGAHNIYNEIGWRYTYNNQYPDPPGTYPPTVAYCYGYNGTGGGQFANDYLGADSFNATPINSIEIIKYTGESIEVCA